MGDMILQAAMDILEAGGYRVDKAYPGQKCQAIGEPVAAVHIFRMDGAKQTVTVEILMACGSGLGGTRCETEAVSAAQLLQDAGASCTVESCEYDGVTRSYSVRIRAEFPADVLLPSEETLIYKDFVWPRKPDSCLREYIREPVYTKNALGNAVFSKMGPKKLTISGSGSFFGETAYEDFKRLVTVFEDAEAGELLHPVWGEVSCYFTELEQLPESRENYVAYRFVFREADSTGAIPK